VLVQHGGLADAQALVEAGAAQGSITWALQLVDHGYDVWLPNNRGTRYSNTNDRDGEWTDAERWNFSWAEMGLYDQPAFFEKIREVTQQEKLTYIGMSQGSSQMLYAMAKDIDYYTERLHRFIGIAPVYDASLILEDLFEDHEAWE